MYDLLLEKPAARAEKISVETNGRSAALHGPEITAGARKSIAHYTEVGKSEGRAILDGAKA